MTTVTFEAYQAAKNEILYGVEFKEETQFPNQWGMSSKQYHTKENGSFYEVTDPNTGIVEFWSDKHAESRYYDSRTREEIIRQYEARLAAAEEERNAAVEAARIEAAKAHARRVPATEYKGRAFSIYREDKAVYDNQKSIGEIVLSEGVYMGGDLYIVPLQVFETENPALLKLVFLVATGGCGMWYSGQLESSFAEVTGNNIRTATMTRDRKLYYHSGAGDCEGIYDLEPQEWRLEEE